MADWRQIQARIRKAKKGPDATAKLAQLFERTRDAMVAWELGVVEEKAGQNSEAAKWYTVAAGRFRRAEWKTKAEEALARLGVASPVTGAEVSVAETTRESDLVKPEQEEALLPLVLGEIRDVAEAAGAAAAPTEAAPQAGIAGEGFGGVKKKRRRGRRGGRGRRRKGAAGAPGLPDHAYTEPSVPAPQAKPVRSEVLELPPPAAFAQTEAPRQRQPEPLPAAPRVVSERPIPGRAGDPGLASRLAQLESMLRRLLASPLRRLDEAAEAPAGPGVLLLSDSDLITNYYVEACQTLRIGLGNLAHGGRAGRGGKSSRGRPETGIKAKLAEHLGISETKVSQYMRDHCVVRWIQLDDDAPHLAHFAIGLLRTPLNED
jgi:hypothetical protein